MYCIIKYIQMKEIEQFEWDRWNIEKIKKKHNVEPYECEEMFFNELFIALDEGHSQKEERFFALGRTDSERLLFVVFTIRVGKVRIISARDMNRKERRIYHEKV